MRQNSHFQRGSGVYNCCDCGRRTRNTGVQSNGSECCPSCYELAGQENCRLDGCLEEPSYPGVRAWFDESVEKGGDAKKLRAAYADLAKAVGWEGGL